MRAFAAWLVASALGITTAGCAGTSGTGFAQPGSAVDDDTGSIVGKVTDDSLFPLTEASVSLDGARLELTGADGTFTFAHVPPGDHLLVASLPGFQESAKTVGVEAGTESAVALVLAYLPGKEPYVETSIGSGLIGCAVSLRHPASSFPLGVAVCGVFAIAGFTSVDRWRTDWGVGSLSASSGAFAETHWTQNQVGAAAMLVQWSTNGTDGTVGTFNSTWGTSPIRLRMPIEEIEAVVAEENNPACNLDRCDWNAYHFAFAGTLGPSAPVDFTLLIQQRFTDYLTFFYNQPLPEEYLAAPDA